MRPMVTGNSGGCLLFFGLLWCAMIGFGDVQIIRSIWRQEVLVRGFAEAPGRILHAQVGEKEGDGTTYGVEVSYEYQVGGVTLRGANYRFGQVYTSSQANAAREVARLPAGLPVKVRYDPADPAVSVLTVGAGGSQWFMLFFLTPFNAVGIALLAVGVAWLRSKSLGASETGRPVIEEGHRVRLALATFPPAGVAVLTVMGVSFALIFVIGLASEASPRPITVLLGSIATGFAALVMYVRARHRAADGVDDLIIDRRAGRVYLPSGARGTERVACGTAEVIGVVVATREEEDSDGDKITKHEPTLRVRSAVDRISTHAITVANDEADARRIARWTEARLREAGARLEERGPAR